MLTVANCELVESSVVPVSNGGKVVGELIDTAFRELEKQGISMEEILYRLSQKFYDEGHRYASGYLARATECLNEAAFDEDVEYVVLFGGSSD